MIFDLLNERKRKRAIAYYRHSAEDKQENSVEIQHDQAVKFASENGIEIIHEISDEGKSGLSASRPGFDTLFRDWINNPNAPLFEYILVYDPSRWGRFEDKNLAGHLEYLCKEDGKEVVYVSIGFPRGEEDQFGLNMRITMEREMAFIYSKNLSSKVFFGSVKVVQQGYSAGGTACYGMARLLLDTDRKPIGLLKKGDHKVIANQRVIFVPANDDTTEIVKRIFDEYVRLWKTPQDITADLIDDGILSPGGGEWRVGAVIRILMNETYAGSLTYNKRSNKLKRGIVQNDRTKWVVTKGAFDPVISQEVFANAQERLYWMNASVWGKGKKMINKTRHRAVSELYTLLCEKELFSAADALSVNKFPIVFGITCRDSKGKRYWCFRIPEAFLTSSHIVCLATELFNAAIGKQLFIISAEHIQYPGHCLIHEDSELFRNSLVSASDAESRIVEMAQIWV